MDQEAPECPRQPGRLGLGFMALCPIVPIMVCSLSKDTFFSWVYLIWLVFFSDCVVCGHVDKRHFVALAVSGALMVLTRAAGRNGLLEIPRGLFERGPGDGVAVCRHRHD